MRRNVFRLAASLLLVAAIATGSLTLLAKPAGGGGWTPCPWPPCLAPCAFPPEPEVLCKERGGGQPTVTSFTCCCCGASRGTSYKALD